MSLVKEIDKNISEEEYLSGELLSDIKHEYINGQAYAMAGASTNHNRVMTNLVSELRLRLKNSSCEPFSSDMKVKITDDYFYPDAMVVCDHIANDNGITDAPLIIVEVLSKSTRQIDQTLKRNAYQSLESLQEYVVIEQDFCEVEVFRKTDDWKSTFYFLGDEISFASINTVITVEDIYYHVKNEDMDIFLKEKESGKH
ncbi:MAG: Uma2 family endonuclease [Bacteroidales bacterium]|nr:Uma2 family endonuclease [Bacteroidales bacterium]